MTQFCVFRSHRSFGWSETTSSRRRISQNVITWCIHRNDTILLFVPYSNRSALFDSTHTWFFKKKLTATFPKDLEKQQNGGGAMTMAVFLLTVWIGWLVRNYSIEKTNVTKCHNLMFTQKWRNSAINSVFTPVSSSHTLCKLCFYWCEWIPLSWLIDEKKRKIFVQISSTRIHIYLVWIIHEFHNK